MRVVIQRVSFANVIVESKLVAEIGNGMLLLLGIESEDGNEDLEWIVNKISNMRIFNDDLGKMNLSVTDVKGDFLVISQFTLHASTKKGNRPSFLNAARPEQAVPLYEKFIQLLSSVSGTSVKSGIFGADMKVSLLNDGPVTIIIDSKNKE